MKKIELTNGVERNSYGVSEKLAKTIIEAGFTLAIENDGFWLYDGDADHGTITNIENAFIEDGFIYDLNKACEYMNDEEREHIHSLVAPCDGQTFWEEFKSEYPDSVDEVMSCLY